MTETKLSVLQEAHQNITDDKRTEYGPIHESFERIASLTKNMLDVDELYLLTRGQFPSTVVCKVMIATKLARQSQRHKRDNLIDLAVYTGLLAELDEQPRIWRLYKVGDLVTTTPWTFTGRWIEVYRMARSQAGKHGPITVCDAGGETEATIDKDGVIEFVRGPEWIKAKTERVGGLGNGGKAE